MKSHNTISATILTTLLLFICLLFGCSDNPTDPEPTTDEFFTFALDTGDFLIYQGPSHGLTIEGPDTVHWHWVDGNLFMGNHLATVRVRPITPFPSHGMSESQIITARTRYDSVPFIDEWLEGIPEPSNAEWAEAFLAWFVARADLSLSVKIQFRDDDREDRALVVSEIAESLNQHELMVPGSVWFTPEEDIFNGIFDLWTVFKGTPPLPDGSPDEALLVLSPSWDEPEPSPTSISREDALITHYRVNTLFESSRGPLLIDLSSGWSIHTLGD